MTLDEIRKLAEQRIRLDTDMAGPNHLALFAIAVLDALNLKNTPPSERAAVRSIIVAIAENMERLK